MGNGMNKVLPGLYVGNFRDSKDQQQLTEHGITHILAIHDNARKLPCNNDKEYLCIIASDSPGQNLTQFFPVCNDFIHAARLKGGAVLIHCLAGMSRSVTVAVIYVMCVTSLGWRDALKAVQGARNVANPNVGFLKQIQEFEKERLHEEKRRLRDKYNDSSLEVEDNQMTKDLLVSYEHYMRVGEMCDGNCHPGVVCPRGLCHTSRSSGIFRRNSRESSGRPSSPLCRQYSNPGSLVPPSPNYSPEPSRNPSPVSSPIVAIRAENLESNTALTPPASPCKFSRRLNSPVDAATDSRLRRSHSPLSDQPTSPGSPSRNYSYYTDESPGSSPSVSFKRTLQRNDSTSRFYCNGKIIHCPSTPPASPSRASRKRNTQMLTPPSSPSLRNRSNNKDTQVTTNRNLNSYQKRSTSTESTKSVIKQVLKKNASLKKSNWLHYHREAKSLDTNHLSEVSYGSSKQSVPNSPSRSSIDAGVKTSPSRFCQVVTRLLPQLVALNNSSKSCKKLPSKLTSKQPTNLYVDKDGKASVVPFEGDVLDSPADDSIGTSENVSDSNAVVFELCKNIQKLRKDDNPYPCNLNDSNPEKNLNTNIIINPIFSMDSDFIGKNTPPCNSIPSCSAFLKDDMIYVETNSDVPKQSVSQPPKNSKSWDSNKNSAESPRSVGESPPKQDITMHLSKSSTVTPDSDRQPTSKCTRPALGAPPPIPPRRNSLVKNRESTPPPVPPRKPKAIPLKQQNPFEDNLW